MIGFAAPRGVNGKPVIGIMMDENTSKGGQLYETSKAYFRAVSDAGGVPVGLAYDASTPDFALQTCHGLVVCGGRVRFPDEWYIPGRQSGSPPSERIDVEQSLVRLWMATQRPYLGICHGMQVLSALHGAKLTPNLRADFPNALIHDTPEARHPVTVTAGSLLHKITGAEMLTVNSLHSEAVMQLSDALAITARAPDGIIEAVEVIGHPFALGLQWHPERLAAGTPREPEPALTPAKSVFFALIQAASLGFSP